MYEKLYIVPLLCFLPFYITPLQKVLRSIIPSIISYICNRTYFYNKKDFNKLNWDVRTIMTWMNAIAVNISNIPNQSSWKELFSSPLLTGNCVKIYCVSLCDWAIKEIQSYHRRFITNIKNVIADVDQVWYC